MAAPASPFSSRPLPAWIDELQQAALADERYRALLAINSIASPLDAVAWCRHALRDADPGVRALAAKKLGEWRRGSRDAASGHDLPWAEIGAELTPRLNDPDPDVQFESARALTQVDPAVASARELLLRLLDDEGTQPLMVAHVLSALAERPDADAEALVPRLRGLLAHPQAEVRENASALVAASPPSAAALTAELTLALDDDEPIVRENAALALGQCGITSTEIMAALSVASEDDDEGVATAARSALQRMRR